MKRFELRIVKLWGNNTKSWAIKTLLLKFTLKIFDILYIFDILKTSSDV